MFPRCYDQPSRGQCQPDAEKRILYFIYSLSVNLTILFAQNICFFYILVKNYFHFLGIIAIVCCIDKQVAQICPLWHSIHLCWLSHNEFIHHRKICQQIGVHYEGQSFYTAVFYLALIVITYT